VSFELLEEGPVNIAMYDFSGKQVNYIQEGYLSIGKHNIEIPVSNLQRGMYILHTSTGKDQISRKIRVGK
jgi:hypothetical protein